jgi:hypothetical protein
MKTTNKQLLKENQNLQELLLEAQSLLEEKNFYSRKKMPKSVRYLSN